MKIEYDDSDKKALECAQYLKNYCMNKADCSFCVFRAVTCNGIPQDWDLEVVRRLMIKVGKEEQESERT